MLLGNICNVGSLELYSIQNGLMTGMQYGYANLGIIFFGQNLLIKSENKMQGWSSENQWALLLIHLLTHWVLSFYFNGQWRPIRKS